MTWYWVGGLGEAYANLSERRVAVTQELRQLDALNACAMDQADYEDQCRYVGINPDSGEPLK